MSRYISTETDGALLVVTLDRADKLNAFHPDAHAELEDTWNGFFADPELRVAILTGAGERAFSVGSDLTGYGDAGGKGLLRLPPHGYAGLTHRLDAPKPIIAAVNGLALGGGFEVMLCCDLAVASENAEFGLPEPLVGATCPANAANPCNVIAYGAYGEATQVSASRP